MSKVKLYTTDFCFYCSRAKKILESTGIEFEEINIHGSRKMREEIYKLTGRHDVPQVFVDEKHIGDDDDLAELVESGQLNQILQ